MELIPEIYTLLIQKITNTQHNNLREYLLKKNIRDSFNNKNNNNMELLNKDILNKELLINTEDLNNKSN